MPAERARSRVESLAVAGLDVPTFSLAATEVLRSALPFTAACMAPVDPATEILTGTVKWGGLTDDEALVRACAVGALTATRVGAQPALPTHDELTTFLER